MNLQQLEYIIAVDKHSNFVKASEACFVTQATLSMMVKKLEEELGVKLFDRSRKPIKTTEIGEKIISQSRKIILESARLKELVNDEKRQIAGELKIGIIPTLAPYLLPLFLKKIMGDFPKVNLIIHEYPTDEIVKKLKLGELDAGLLSTPLNDVLIKEQVLFYEQFFLYVNAQEKGFDKQYVLPKDIDINRLWLLEEGFCMRSQVLNLCDLKKQNQVNERINYEAGSIETLKNLVENNYGITIIPELATHHLSSTQKKRLRYFKSPAPVREISIVTHREYIKFRLIEALTQTILSVIPKESQSSQRIKIIKF